ncbi:TonB-dependent receptor [Marinicauda salina]|nr:TonB-dependent receptor [Marinicauda salina]
MSFRKRLLGATAILAGLSAAPLAAPAIAQEAEASDSSQGEVILVTARRREESLQDVPLSVSAFSGEDLLELGAQDITYVGNVSPNVTLEVSRGTNTTLTAFIRGIGQQDPVAGFEAGVGIYLDDVYLNRPQAAVLDIYDVERVEVLRGPQGTLYGRNTVGGAVKYVTAGLSDEPELTTRLNFGTYNQFDAIVHGSIPLDDRFRVGGAIARFSRDGFGQNFTLGRENYNKDVWAGRLSAELDVTPDFQIRVSGDYTQDNSNARQGHRLIPDQFPPFEYPVLDDVYHTLAGLNFPEQEVEAYGGQMTAEWTINENVTLKNIVAYREDESTTPIDFDSLPEADLDVPAIYENDQFSEELQLLYNGERTSGVVGFYYLDANASTAFDVILDTTGDIISLPGLTAQTFGDVATETWSIFGDFTYSLTPEIEVSLGGRYTEDERSSRVLRTTFINGPSDFFGGGAIPIAITSDFEGSESWTDFSPRASISWAPNDTHNFYFTYSQGFKGGSFDPRGQTSAAPDFDGDGTVSEDEIFEFMRFDPEEVDSYEIGWKVDVGRYRHSLAYFYTDYTDVQVPGSVGVDTDDDGVADTFTGVTTNAGEAEISGIEYEGYALIGEDALRRGDTFTANWSLGFLDGEYKEFIDAFGDDISDEVGIQNTPDITGSATLNYTVPVRGGDLSIINTVIYRGDTQQFELPSPIDQEAYTLWNLSAVWTNDDGRWQVGVHGRNLTDERYRVAGYDFVDEGPGGTFTPTLGLEGTLTGFYGDPRTVTATISYRY